MNMINMHKANDALMEGALSVLHSLTFGTLFLVFQKLFFLSYLLHLDQ